MPLTAIAFLRSRAHLRTAFCYFLHFYYFYYFTVFLLLTHEQLMKSAITTIDNYERHTKLNTCALFLKSSLGEAHRRFDSSVMRNAATANYSWLYFSFLHLSPTNIDNQSRLSRHWKKKLSAISHEAVKI